jgi:hypothetical protein
MINIGKWESVNDMIQPMTPIAMIEEFDSEEIDRIESIAQNQVTKKWDVEGASFTGTFIPFTDETAWLYGRIHKLFEHVNSAYDLKNLDMIEHVWVMEFSEGDHEDYHTDLNAGVPYCSRALSMIINLNDSDEYRGGEISFLNGSTNYVLKRSKGTATVHPSYLYKKLEKVTSGKKRILLAWISNNSNNI